MNKIKIIFHQFTMNQDIFVYTDNKIIDKYETTLDNMLKCVEDIKSKYNIKEINLLGNRIYISKFKEQLQNKFSKNNIKIVEI